MYRKMLQLLIGVVVMLALLIGAFTSHVTKTHAAPADQPSLAIPYLSQYEGQSTQNFDCGPTSVAMLIAYYNGAPNESSGSFITDVRNAINAARPQNDPTFGDTTPSDLEAALSTYGLIYAEIPNTLSPQPTAEIQAMEQATASGRPVIAIIHGADFGRGQNYGDHFVVVTGFSSDGQTVFLNDPDNQSPKLPGWIQGGQISVPVSTFSQAAYDATPGPYGIIVGKNDPTTPTPMPTATNQASPVVVMIHGISNTEGAADDCDNHNTWGDAISVLEAHGYNRQQLVTLGYYGADQKSTDGQSGCDDLISGIAHTLDPSGNTVSSDCGNTNPITFDNNTPIETLSCYVSWYLYLKYTAQGIPVQLVGHSLGGIIIRYAMYKAGQSDYYYNSDYAYTLNFAPPALVTDVVTLETPHGGVPGPIASGLCNDCLEGRELDLNDNNTFMQDLISDPASATPNGSGMTQWNMIGSGCNLDWTISLNNCLGEGFNTSTKMQGGNKYKFDCQNFTTSSCYNHNGVLTDSSTALDENIDYCGNCAPDPQHWDTRHGEPHSLTLVADLLLHQF